LHRFCLKLLAQNLMTGVKKNKEPYSTREAWEGAEPPELKHWRRMAEHFRKENKELKEEIKALKKNRDDYESYIERVLSLRETEKNK